MGPFAIAALGAGAGLLGGERQNTANAKQAQKQMDFQERMSNTSYQRAVADMKAAGLNPALAYQQGGAQSPAGTSARMENSAAAATNSAAAAGQTYSAIQTQKENQALVRAQRDKTIAETENTRAEALARIADLTARAGETGQRTRTERHRTGTEYWHNRWLNDTYADRREKLRREIDLDRVHAREATARSVLEELGQPAARNRAHVQSSWFKKRIAPYLNDATQVNRVYQQNRRD